MKKNYLILFIFVLVSSINAGIMEGFPPLPADQVTSENWMEAPFNQWGFQNVRRLSPTIEFQKGDGPIVSLPKEEKKLLDLSLMNHDVNIAQMLDQTKTDAFLVIHKGKIVVEEYFNTMQPASVHIIWSGSKSILGSIAGIMVKKGLINLEMPVSYYIPELSNSGYSDSKIRDLLDMTVAMEPKANDDFSSFKPDRNWSSYRFVKELKKEGNHGDKFTYTSTNAVVLGWVIEKAANKELIELISELIWAPLGVEFEANSIVDGIGTAQPSGGFSMSLRDFGRFGQMILQKGNFKEKQIVPSEWIEDIRKNGNKEIIKGSHFDSFIPGGHYHNMWWVNNDGSLMAPGAYGQILYIDFDTETVIVKFSSQSSQSDGHLHSMTLDGIHQLINTFRNN